MHNVSARAFTWTGPSGSIEASDLTGLLGAHADFRYGLRVRSERTGQAVEFHYTQALRDDDGETIGWQLTDRASSILITVYND